MENVTPYLGSRVESASRRCWHWRYSTVSSLCVINDNASVVVSQERITVRLLPLMRYWRGFCFRWTK